MIIDGIEYGESPLMQMLRNLPPIDRFFIMSPAHRFAARRKPYKETKVKSIGFTFNPEMLDVNLEIEHSLKMDADAIFRAFKVPIDYGHPKYDREPLENLKIANEQLIKQIK